MVAWLMLFISLYCRADRPCCWGLVSRSAARIHWWKYSLQYVM